MQETCVQVRRGERVVSAAPIIAIGLNSDGARRDNDGPNWGHALRVLFCLYDASSAHVWDDTPFGTAIARNPARVFGRQIAEARNAKA